MPKGAFDALGRVDVPPAHPRYQRLGRHIADHNLIGTVEYPVGHLLANTDSGECLNARGKAVNMLDVDGGENVDATVEQQQHVFVALTMAASFDVRMCQFVDKRYLRGSSQNGVDIHLREQSALVLHLAASYLFQLVGQLRRSTASVGLH